MNPPHHLQTEDPLQDTIFFDNEKIFRRFPVRSNKTPGDLFSIIPTAQWIKGVSTFREKYISSPIDALWRIFVNGNNQCDYELKKNHAVHYLEYSWLKSGEEKLGIQIICEHKPEKCNKAHCDLYFNPPIEIVSDETKVNMRLLIGTLFCPTGINN